MSRRRRLETRAGAAAALKIPPREFDRWQERGAPPPKKGPRGSKRYDVAAIKRWRQERQARTRPALDLAHERARLAHVQTQLTTLKLREARGELIRAADAAQAQRAIAAAVKAQLLAVPSRAVLAGLPRPHEALVKKLITEALRELAAVRTLAELQEAAS